MGGNKKTVIQEKLLTLILDNTNKNINDEGSIVEENVDFFHSLGLKCDSVGWCRLDLTKPNSEELLTVIEDYSNNHRYRLRGTYYENYTGFESEWYSLLPAKYLDYNSEIDTVEVLDKKGKRIEINEIYAYKVPRSTSYIATSPHVLVTEKFRNVSIENAYKGIDYYWIKDKGKYCSRQFFGMIINNKIDNFACDYGLDYFFGNKKFYEIKNGINRRNRFDAIGGIMPRLYRSFYRLGIDLPIYLPKNNMPDSDFAYIHTDKGNGYYQVLLRRNVVNKMIEQRVLKKEDFQPMLLYDEPPNGFVTMTSESVQYPSETIVKQLIIDYDNLKYKNKPKRIISKKDTVELLRVEKERRSDDFLQKMPKSKRDELLSTPYKSLIPYYAIANGGDLSSEYYFLPYEQTKKENINYKDQMEKEEILENKAFGHVIALCSNGDVVILSKNNTIKRISHEGGHEVVSTWDKLENFIYSTLEESIIY